MKICSKCQVEKENICFYRWRVCRDCERIQHRLWQRKDYALNPQKTLTRDKRWRIKNKEKVKKMKSRYEKKHRKAINAKLKVKRATNLNYRLSINLRNRIRKVLVGINKSESTMNLLGCSLDFFKIHIQNQFQKDMTWKNYGAWHIDHIEPCFSFDLSCPNEQKKCFHYTNLQPLWAIQNLSKGSKLQIKN